MLEIALIINYYLWWQLRGRAVWVVWDCWSVTELYSYYSDCSPGSVGVCMAALTGHWSSQLSGPPWDSFFRRGSARIYFQSLFSLIFIHLGGASSCIIILLYCYVVSSQFTEFRNKLRLYQISVLAGCRVQSCWEIVYSLLVIDSWSGGSC